jgi:hypothetical protein
MTKRYLSASEDRVCFCCNRRESVITHVRVGREGTAIASRTRALMTWYRVAS